MATPTASPPAAPRPTVRVAAVQSAPVAYDLHKSLHKLRSLAFAAKENGAELVVFPEAWLSGYPRHLDFRVGARSQEARDWYGRYVRASVKIPPGALGTDWLRTSSEQAPGAPFWAFQQLAQIARKYSIFLSVGVVEAAPVGSTLWCSNLLFSALGVLVARHRKVQGTGAERVLWSQGEATNARGVAAGTGTGAGSGGGSGGAKRGRDGQVRSSEHGHAHAPAPGVRDDNLPVVATPLGRIGGLVGWENLMPLARYLLYKKGVEIYLAPTADGQATWLPCMQHIAQEGRCFVVTANQYHSSADFPADYPPALDARLAAAAAAAGAVHPCADKLPEMWSRGGSAIIGPLGDVLAGPLWDKEGILYADIDLGTIDGAKLDFDPVGHYSREDMLMELLYAEM